MLIPVLMYHDIRPDDYRLPEGIIENAPYVLAGSEFRKQIEFIAHNRIATKRVCDLGRVGPELKSDQSTEKGRGGWIALSFDDGDVSNYDRAFTLFLQYGLKATFFITTDFVERQGYVSWQQLREMHAAGMEIGSHSVSHPVPSLLNDLQLSYELLKSKEILENRLGSKIESFSLPRGFNHPNLERLAREAGYSAVCNSRRGYVNTAALQPFNINRIAIKRTTRFDEFSSYARCSGYLMKRKVVEEKLMNGVKGFLGVEKYDRIRKLILGRIYG